MNCACPDLCGGCPAMGIPTAIPMPTHCGLGHWRTIQTLPRARPDGGNAVQAAMVAMVAMVASRTPCRAGDRREGRPARQATQR